MNKLIENLNIDRLAEILVLSNTPFYLYRNFSADESVKSLSVNKNSVELIQYFNNYLNKDIAKIEDFVALYSIIVALSLKPNSEVLDFFDKLDEVDLKWSKYFKEIYMSKILPESNIVLDCNYKVRSKISDSKTFSNYSHQKDNQKPKIIIL